MDKIELKKEFWDIFLNRGLDFAFNFLYSKLDDKETLNILAEKLKIQEEIIKAGEEIMDIMRLPKPANEDGHEVFFEKLEKYNNLKSIL